MDLDGKRDCENHDYTRLCWGIVTEKSDGGSIDHALSFTVEI